MKERGAIALFALVACLFFMVVLTGAYIFNLNKLNIQEQHLNQIKDNYSKELIRKEEIYDELKNDTQ